MEEKTEDEDTQIIHAQRYLLVVLLSDIMPKITSQAFSHGENCPQDKLHIMTSSRRSKTTILFMSVQENIT